jgi:hypothetical protein
MNNNEPLDQINFKEVTAQQIVQKLQQAGFHEVYEIDNGGVQVKGIYPLNCEIKQDKTGVWFPDITVDTVSAYVIIPSIILIGLCKLIFGIGGALPMAICVIIGMGIGNMIVKSKREDVEKRLGEVIGK